MSEWPTESEAAALLGASVKTLHRYAAKGLIEIQKRPRPGKKPENVCNPRDIERLKPAAHVMPESAPVRLPAVRETSLAPLLPSFGALIQTISTAIVTMQADVQ